MILVCQNEKGFTPFIATQEELVSYYVSCTYCFHKNFDIVYLRTNYPNLTLINIILNHPASVKNSLPNSVRSDCGVGKLFRTTWAIHPQRSTNFDT